jgi:hypothetical protein
VGIPTIEHFQQDFIDLLVIGLRRLNSQEEGRIATRSALARLLADIETTLILPRF